VISVSLAVVGSGSSAQTGRDEPDPALLNDLLQWASRLSGMPLAPVLPAVQALSPDDLARRVCPDEPANCRTLVALYDTDRREVLYRNTLDLRDETDQSFIVHELVHYLQHLRDGDELFSSCERVLAAETAAYAVQNRYLTHFKQWRRVGEMLRFTHCRSARIDPDYRPGEVPALTSRSPQVH
jgi:hypothetical protein